MPISCTNPGISESDIIKLRVWYPSMRAVKGHRMANGNIRVIIVDLVGVKSHRDSTKLKYRILIDLSRFPSEPPESFVLYPKSDQIHHVNIGYGNKNNLAPNREICQICQGQIGAVFKSWSDQPLARMRGFMNHLENILNTPNTGSRMRG